MQSRRRTVARCGNVVRDRVGAWLVALIADAVGVKNAGRQDRFAGPPPTGIIRVARKFPCHRHRDDVGTLLDCELHPAPELRLRSAYPNGHDGRARGNSGGFSGSAVAGNNSGTASPMSLIVDGIIVIRREIIAMVRVLTRLPHLGAQVGMLVVHARVHHGDEDAGAVDAALPQQRRVHAPNAPCFRRGCFS